MRNQVSEYLRNPELVKQNPRGDRRLRSCAPEGSSEAAARIERLDPGPRQHSSSHHYRANPVSPRSRDEIPLPDIRPQLPDPSCCPGSGTGPTGSGEGVVFHSIPPNTPVGMSSPFVHMNPEIFSDPHTFTPERWLEPDAKNLHGYILSFSKGSRACLGINLAYAELHVGIAVIMRRFGERMESFDTDLSDVEMVHDCLVPIPRQDSKGIRVLIRGA